MNISNFKKTFTLSPDLVITIERIDNILHRLKLLLMSDSSLSGIDILLNPEFNLPQIYAGLRHLTGPGDYGYDDYKGSFNFTFKLDVKKPDYETEYIYKIRHYRASVAFYVQEIVAADDPRDSRLIYSPDDKRFSETDIHMFSICFLKFAIKSAENEIITPFVKSSDSNFILFGYKDNKYFYKTYIEQDEYINEKLLLKEEIYPIFSKYTRHE
jgi:hypothetical protein